MNITLKEGEDYEETFKNFPAHAHNCFRHLKFIFLATRYLKSFSFLARSA